MFGVPGCTGAAMTPWAPWDLLGQVPRDHEEQRARRASLGGEHRHQDAQAPRLQRAGGAGECPKGMTFFKVNQSG